MSSRILLVLILATTCNYIFSGDISPKNAVEAKDLFLASFNERQSFDQRILNYEAVLQFYQGEKDENYDVYAMYTLQNLAILYMQKHKYEKAFELWHQALHYAQKKENRSKVMDFYLQLGHLYTYVVQDAENIQLNSANEWIRESGNIIECENPFVSPTMAPRKLSLRIDYNFIPETFEADPDEITFSLLSENKVLGEAKNIKSGIALIPGRYLLKIRKKGYEDIQEYIIVSPKEGTFYLSRRLKVKLRKMVFNIEGKQYQDEPPGFINPDNITLNEKSIMHDPMVKPGEYDLVIEKDGYYSIAKKICILPGEEEYKVEEFMEMKLREVHVKIIDRNFEEISADVHLGCFLMKKENMIIPGSYLLKIRKDGYLSSVERIIIKASDQPYILERILFVAPREIKINITTAKRIFFPKINFQPVCTLNGIDVKTQKSFMPGMYELKIECPDYIPIIKQIEIAKSWEPYTIEAKLVPEDD